MRYQSYLFLVCLWYLGVTTCTPFSPSVAKPPPSQSHRAADVVTSHLSNILEKMACGDERTQVFDLDRNDISEAFELLLGSGNFKPFASNTSRTLVKFILDKRLDHLTLRLVNKLEELFKPVQQTNELGLGSFLRSYFLEHIPTAKAFAFSMIFDPETSLKSTMKALAFALLSDPETTTLTKRVRRFFNFEENGVELFSDALSLLHKHVKELVYDKDRDPLLDVAFLVALEDAALRLQHLSDTHHEIIQQLGETIVSLLANEICQEKMISDGNSFSFWFIEKAFSYGCFDKSYSGFDVRKWACYKYIVGLGCDEDLTWEFLTLGQKLSSDGVYDELITLVQLINRRFNKIDLSKYSIAPKQQFQMASLALPWIARSFLHKEIPNISEPDHQLLWATELFYEVFDEAAIDLTFSVARTLFTETVSSGKTPFEILNKAATEQFNISKAEQCKPGWIILSDNNLKLSSDFLFNLVRDEEYGLPYIFERIRTALNETEPYFEK